MATYNGKFDTVNATTAGNITGNVTNFNGTVGAATVSGTLGTVTLNSQLTPNYSYPFTIGSNALQNGSTAAISTSDKVGYVFYQPLVFKTVLMNGGQYSRRVLTVPKGVYMVSWSSCFVGTNGNCTGMAGFLCTGTNVVQDAEVSTWGGYNFYQSGYAEIKYSPNNGTALTGSTCVFIGDGSTHNTIILAAVFSSAGQAVTDNIQTSLNVVRIA